MPIKRDSREDYLKNRERRTQKFGKLKNNSKSISRGSSPTAQERGDITYFKGEVNNIPRATLVDPSVVISASPQTTPPTLSAKEKGVARPTIRDRTTGYEAQDIKLKRGEAVITGNERQGTMIITQKPTLVTTPRATVSEANIDYGASARLDRFVEKKEREGEIGLAFFGGVAQTGRDVIHSVSHPRETAEAALIFTATAVTQPQTIDVTSRYTGASGGGRLVGDVLTMKYIGQGVSKAKNYFTTTKEVGSLNPVVIEGGGVDTFRTTTSITKSNIAGQIESNAISGVSSKPPSVPRNAPIISSTSGESAIKLRGVFDGKESNFIVKQAGTSKMAQLGEVAGFKAESLFAVDKGTVTGTTISTGKTITRGVVLKDYALQYTDVIVNNVRTGRSFSVGRSKELFANLNTNSRVTANMEVAFSNKGRSYLKELTGEELVSKVTGKDQTILQTESISDRNVKALQVAVEEEEALSRTGLITSSIPKNVFSPRNPSVDPSLIIRTTVAPTTKAGFGLGSGVIPAFTTTSLTGLSSGTKPDNKIKIISLGTTRIADVSKSISISSGITRPKTNTIPITRIKDITSSGSKTRPKTTTTPSLRIDTGLTRPKPAPTPKTTSRGKGGSFSFSTPFPTSRRVPLINLNNPLKSQKTASKKKKKRGSNPLTGFTPTLTGQVLGLGRTKGLPASGLDLRQSKTKIKGFL